MTADRFCQSFPWSFWTLASFPRTGCCWPDFVGAWEVFHPLGMGSFSGKPLMLSATTQPMVTGLFSWGYASTSHWEPRQKNCLPDFAGFRLTLALGNLVVAGVVVQERTWTCHVFFPKCGDDFWICFKGFCQFSFRKSGERFKKTWCCPEQLSSSKLGFDIAWIPPQALGECIVGRESRGGTA